jgi:selenocysteine lyase/cysteine desulfurase
MKSDKYNRKKFFGRMGTIAAGSVIIKTLLPTSSAQAQIISNFPGGFGNEYLFSEGLTYLNTGTLGPCRRETIEESLKKWEELETLPVKFYGGWGAQALAEKTRTIAANFLGCDISELMITSSTTNGMNAIAQGLRLKEGDRILTTDQEHGGGILCWEYLSRYHGVILDKISIPPGKNNTAFILQRFKEELRKKTRVVSISHVFSSTGLRMPVAEISTLARSSGALCIVDGAQAAGGIEVDVKKLGCHAYATSGHKWIMGPKGTGLLYISKDAQDVIKPMQFEKSYNTYNDGNGAVNLACILGLGKAIEYLQSVRIDEVEKHNLSLRNRLYQQVINLKNATVLSPTEGTLASPMLTLLLKKPFDKNELVKMLLEKYKISIRPTHKEFGFNGIRFSMHIFNTEKEIDFASEVLNKELA